MKHLHEDLRQRFSWYDRWHNTPQNATMHWALLVLLLVVMANVLHAIGQQFVVHDTYMRMPAAAVRSVTPQPLLDLTSTSKLPTAALEAIARAQAEKSTRRHKVAKVNIPLLDDRSSGAASTVLVELFDGQKVTIDRDRVDRRGNDNFTWYGKARGHEGSDVFFTVVDGYLTGHLTLVEGGKVKGQYTIEYAGEDVYTLKDVDFSNVPDHPQKDDGETATDVLPEGGGNVDGGVTAADTAEQIDVMILFSDQSTAALGGSLFSYAQSAVDSANRSFANSGLVTRLRLVHAGSVSYSEVGDFSTDLSRLAAIGDGYADEAHTLRNTYGADLVSLFVESSGYCGIGYLNSSASSAFTVVSRGCATSNLSFAHEVGHNLGARHDPYVDASVSPYAYAHGYTYPAGGWRTVMAYNNACSAAGSSCARIAYWSNPLQLFSGVPMGTPESGSNPTSDNARVLRLRGDTVANFKTTSSGGGGGTTTPTCTRANPTITVAPTSQNGSAGQSVTYSVTVTNNDSPGCVDSAFAVTSTLPSGLTQSPASFTVTLAPGARQSQSVVVTSGLTLQPGTLNFTQTALNSSVAGPYTALANVSYVVVGADTTAPTVSITSPTEGTVLTARKGASKINIQASASDASGIARIDLFIDSALVKSCGLATSCSYNWNYSRVTAGSHSIRAVAIDSSSAGNSGSAVMSVTK